MKGVLRLSTVALGPLSLSALALVGVLALPVPASAGNCDSSRKVDICHATGRGEYHTIRVSECAVQSHLAKHGDYVGACETNCAIEASCDDGNPCTSDACDPATGQCLNTVVSCDDGNPCTDDSCDPAQGGCVASPLPGAPCDDNDSCSTGDSCTSTGDCAGTPVAGCCQSQADCEDGNPCTTDICDASTQTCRRDQRVCEDGDLCTVDTCNPQTGNCDSTPIACETGSSCDPNTGICVPTGPEICGDGLDNDRDGIVDDRCIGDRAWHDLDFDGVQDPGEPGLAGVTFILRDGNTGAVVQITVSDATGAYHFSDIPAGTYFIEALAQGDFTATLPDQGDDDTLDSDFSQEDNLSPVFAFPVDGSINHIDAGFTLGD